MVDFVEVTRKLAARRQIDAAIDHLFKREFECAITLAGAAETMLPDETEKPYIFASAAKHPLFKKAELNDVINWLKHYKLPDTKIIFERDVVIVVFRAMSKYVAVFNEAPESWHRFREWGTSRGHFDVES